MLINAGSMISLATRHLKAEPEGLADSEDLISAGLTSVIFSAIFSAICSAADEEAGVPIMAL